MLEALLATDFRVIALVAAAPVCAIITTALYDLFF